MEAGLSLATCLCAHLNEKLVGNGGVVLRGAEPQGITPHVALWLGQCPVYSHTGRKGEGGSVWASLAPDTAG